MIKKFSSRVNVGIRQDQAALIRGLVGYGKGKFNSVNTFVQEAVDKKLKNHYKKKEV